jgi:hypothetical protein
VGRSDDLGVIGQAKVIVGAKIEDLATALNGDFYVLGCGNDTLGFIQSGFPDFP